MTPQQQAYQQAQRNAPSVEDLAHKDVDRGPYSFRYATPAWYSLTMHIARNWRVSDVEPPAELQGAIIHIPSSLETEKQAFKSTNTWIKEAQSEGYGVIAMVTGDESQLATAKTKQAKVAQQITKLHPSNFVLNEPREGWTDLHARASFWAFPLFAAMGLVGSITLMEMSK